MSGEQLELFPETHWKTIEQRGITYTIYTGGVSKKDTGWTQDMGDHGTQDLTWLL